MAGNSPFERRHLEQRTSKNADQTELMAVLSGEVAVDAGLYDDEVAGVLDDFEQPLNVAIGLDWHQRDLAKEDGVGSIHEEIERRSNLLGRLYPFKLKGNSIAYTPTANGVYEFCLAAAIQSDIASKPFAYIPRAFERISALIVQEFAGNAAYSFHVGAPRLGSTPSRFSDAMKLIEEATGEWAWRPSEFYPEEHASTGDEGLDFLVGKRPGDLRQGQLFFIGQCACGDDWSQKFHDLNFKKIGKWFNPPWYVDPVRVLTTPHVLSAGNLLDSQPEAGMILDRVRLTSLSATCSLESEFAPWPTELRKLAELVIRSTGAPLPNYTPPFELAARSEHA